LDLPAAERARRYADKNRIQSLLIQRFAEEIEVIPDPGEGEGVVILRHRPSGSSASHAVIAELGEEARMWVQTQIDLGAAGSPAAPSPSPTSSRKQAKSPIHAGEDPSGGEMSLPELLEAGSQARDAYDYGLARSLFTRALEQSGGAAAAAAALLD